MPFLFYLTLFFGVIFFAICIWIGIQLWLKKYGRKNTLLNQRIQALTIRVETAEARASIFKESLFSENPEINNLLKRISLAHKLDNLIKGAGFTLLVHDLLVIELVGGAIAFLAIWFFMGSALSALWGVLLFMLAPIVYFMVETTKRKTVLEKQLPDLLDFISRSLSAGHSFSSALQSAASQSPEPIGPEFKICFDQLNIGMPIREVMANLVKRIDIDDVRFFAIAVTLNREVGGNLAELLSDVSLLIRERLTTRLVINTLTAEGKMTAKILGILPIAAYIGLSVLIPGYFDPVTKSSFGVQLLVGTGIWATIGFLWMRYLTNVRL
ncbi:type II secretion system F family protein [Polynucleobacter sp. UB-Tiil-W10]|uniref:type II secretion system F family protein n=1 Tax=Polynucleobacter sp. UB-Tiil-W10 TaxID=1855648 RepID=UPI001C0AB370|nr:type II secretion system F family protein [Polynucleobacter sp. UB-Tiil-W10]MBU3541633.1 type II secretion system F family protein [Polynucleobacter sp. UB-Tiil-W10]